METEASECVLCGQEMPKRVTSATFPLRSDENGTKNSVHIVMSGKKGDVEGVPCLDCVQAALSRWGWIVGR